MKKYLVSATALFATTSGSFGLFPLLDHIDIKSTYRPADQTWKWTLVTEDGETDPALVYFAARDVDFPAGEKQYHPGGGEWDFTGVGEGDPLWIYPEASSAYSWLGFSDTTPGLVDPVKYNLVQVLGPTGGHFSLYRVISGVPLVFMSTVDGVDQTDVYDKPPAHQHVNWAFSRKGMWAVDLKVSANLIAGNQPTAPSDSDTARLYFAIGQKAAWHARHSTAATVMDEAVAGDMADPDNDGWVNLLEYAFGGNPRQNGLKRGTSAISAAPVLENLSHQGQNYAGITFFRYRDPARAELEYTVEWQSGLAAGGWSGGGELHQTQIVDTDWERVTYRDQDPLTATPRFVRVRITGE